MPVDEAGRLHATGYSRASSLLTERGNYEAAVPLCLCASVPLWELACWRIPASKLPQRRCSDR